MHQEAEIFAPRLMVVCRNCWFCCWPQTKSHGSSQRTSNEAMGPSSPWPGFCGRPGGMRRAAGGLLLVGTAGRKSTSWHSSRLSLSCVDMKMPGQGDLAMNTSAYLQRHHAVTCAKDGSRLSGTLSRKRLIPKQASNRHSPCAHLPTLWTMPHSLLAHVTKMLPDFQACGFTGLIVVHLQMLQVNLTCKAKCKAMRISCFVG